MDYECGHNDSAHYDTWQLKSFWCRRTVVTDNIIRNNAVYERACSTYLTAPE
jgi:hypothetical protein